MEIELDLFTSFVVAAAVSIFPAVSSVHSIT